MTTALTTPRHATECTIVPLARLEVIARTTPELIERVCRLLRHRGASVGHLVVTADGHLTTLVLTARVSGNVDLLVRHLDRLPDVRRARHG